MDMNLVILCGKLAGPPELRTFDSGSRLLRMLVKVRTDQPRRRLDVVPVTLWATDGESDTDFEAAVEMQVSERVWIAGTVQRRFWSSEEGRRSRLEVVAHSITAADAGLETASV